MYLKRLQILIMILFCFCSFAQDKKVHFNFQTQSDWYISPKAYDEQLDHYWTVSSRMQSQQHHTYVYYDFDVQATISLDASQKYFISIPYANFGYHLREIQTVPFLDSFQFSLGRYKKRWSWLDNYWELGLWNPRNVFDYFNPMEMGVFGSAISFKHKNWSFTSFLGALFIPNEQSSFGDNKAGSIQSRSRWGTPPANQVSILDRELDAYYWIQNTYLTNILLQRSYNVNFTLGSQDSYWLSLSYAKKPLNNIFYRVKTGINISAASLDSSIYHHALNHQLMSVDIGFRWKEWSVYVGILDETLDRIELPQNWIIPSIPHTALFYSGSIARDLNWGKWNRNYIRLSFLSSWIKDQQYTSLIGGSVDSLVSLKRLKMKNGFAVDWTTDFFWGKEQKVKSFLRYWYAFSDKGGWLQWKLSYFFDSQTGLLFECNILGSEDNYKNSFFTWFGNNDRLSLKVQYGF